MDTVRPTTSNSMFYTPRSTKHARRNEFGHSKSENRHGTVQFKRRTRTKGPFTCEVCSENFTGSERLIFHRRLHLDSSSIWFHACLRQFTTDFRKKCHEIDCKAVNYVCYLCGFFQSKLDLKRHMAKHTGIKAYECSKCGKRWAHKVNLTRHEKNFCRKK